MPWFYCDVCCDTVKKPKVPAHLRICPRATFTCIDCSRTFDSHSVQGHNSCVTEVQKYAQGATKPGGVAEGGFYEDGAEPQTIQTAVGTEYLSKKPPWACSICKVSCTSEATLLAHAAGAKHKRRSRAAAGGASGGDGAAKADAGSAAAPREADAQAAAGSAPASSTSPEQAVLVIDQPEDAAAKRPKKRARESAVSASLPEQESPAESPAEGTMVRDTIYKILKKKGPLSLSKLCKLCCKRLGDAANANTILSEVLRLDGADLQASVQLMPKRSASAET